MVHLGADAVWLSPIYRSPSRDFGYDVSDYQAVAPEYGTLANPEYARLSHVHSANAPDIGTALTVMRDAVGKNMLLIGEAYLPTTLLSPYSKRSTSCSPSGR